MTITKLSIEEPLPIVHDWLFYALHKLRLLCIMGDKEKVAIGPLAEDADVVDGDLIEARWAIWIEGLVELWSV